MDEGKLGTSLCLNRMHTGITQGFRFDGEECRGKTSRPRRSHVKVLEVQTTPMLHLALVCLHLVRTLIVLLQRPHESEDFAV